MDHPPMHGSEVWFRSMAPTYGYIIDHTWELRCIVAEVRSNGHRRGCFKVAAAPTNWYFYSIPLRK